MKNNALFSPSSQGIALSLGLHLLILALAYYSQSIPVPGLSGRQTYRIGIQPTIACVPKKHQMTQNDPQRFLEATRPKRPCGNKRTGAKTRKKMVQSSKTSVIDQRGLYKTTQNGTKQAGASLELMGWEWDVVPNPNDTTEECGKVVFEIKVDKNGEIVSIQTLEKTVTPMVEKIYADALRALTFTKTVDYTSGISTGKVTFILVAK